MIAKRETTFETAVENVTDWISLQFFSFCKNEGATELALSGSCDALSSANSNDKRAGNSDPFLFSHDDIASA